MCDVAYLLPYILAVTTCEFTFPFVFYEIFLSMTYTNHDNVTHDVFRVVIFSLGFPLFCFPQRFMAAILTIGYYEVA